MIKNSLFNSKTPFAVLLFTSLCFISSCSKNSNDHSTQEQTTKSVAAVSSVDPGVSKVESSSGSSLNSKPQSLSASRPAFWQVKSPTATVSLMGSMHFGAENFFPLPRELMSAFDAADILVVEVNTKDLSPAAAMSAIMRYGRVEGDQTLDKIVSESTYEKLRRVVEAQNLPISAFNGFKPWYVAIQLVELEIRKTELKQNLGIDMFFMSNAAGKRIEELETVEQQLRLFGDLSLKEQEAFLDQTLDDLNESAKYLEVMAKAWREGDVKQLEESLLKPFKEDPDTKKLYKKIFTDRNIEMTHAVKEYLKGDKNVFFVVGAGHIIGQGGIVDRLSNAGIHALKIQYQGLE